MWIIRVALKWLSFPLIIYYRYRNLRKTNADKRGGRVFARLDFWSIELNIGEFLQGIIKSEIPAAITVVNSGKPDRTINRQEIKSLKTANVSAMPSGLEKNIDQQQMADLLSFLRQN